MKLTIYDDAPHDETTEMRSQLCTQSEMQRLIARWDLNGWFLAVRGSFTERRMVVRGLERPASQFDPLLSARKFTAVSP